MHRPALLLLFLTACATTPVHMNEPRRVVGTEAGVRIDAEVGAEELRAGVPVPIAYSITNGRDHDIAVADIIPVTSYDEESQTLTVDVGTEVPGASLLPRLIVIKAGAKETFNIGARVPAVIDARAGDPHARWPTSLRLRVSFLGDTAPFTKLIGIEEKAVGDPALADALFPLWLEKNETIYTNAVPVHWVGAPMEGAQEDEGPPSP